MTRSCLTFSASFASLLAKSGSVGFKGMGQRVAAAADEVDSLMRGLPLLLSPPAFKALYTHQSLFQPADMYPSISSQVCSLLQLNWTTCATR